MIWFMVVCTLMLTCATNFTCCVVSIVILCIVTLWCSWYVLVWLCYTPPHLLANVQKGGDWYIVGMGSMLMVYGMCCCCCLLWCCCCLLHVLQVGLSQCKFLDIIKKGEIVGRGSYFTYEWRMVLMMSTGLE